jgi:hypothetical protein
MELGKAMRPNYVVTASEVDGRLLLYGLYYNQRKAKKAFETLEKPSIDGSYTIPLEDGRWETAIAPASRPIAKLRFLGNHIWTTRNRWKKSFFDTTEQEFAPMLGARATREQAPNEELAAERDIPVILLKKIANYELDFIEDRGDTRWNARKRLYLPRRFYSWF